MYAVAGAGGFIGSHIVEHLTRADERVVAIDRPGANMEIAERAGAELRHADLLAEHDAFEGAEVVINATGLFDLSASEAKLFAINEELAVKVARAARRERARRLVHISSVAVYGQPTKTPMPEDGEQAPRSDYERSKHWGERTVLALAGLEVTALRPTLVYGPRSTYGQAMMIAMAAQARALGVRRLPLLSGGPLGHHVHVEDVARAALLLATHPDAPGRSFNVADDEPLPLGDSLLVIARAFGLRGLDTGAPSVWRVLRALTPRLPQRLLDRLNRQLARGHRALQRRGMEARLSPRLDEGWLQYLRGDYVFDTERLRSLGFVPKHPSYARSIQDVIAWYRDAGWIAPTTMEEAA